MHSREYQQALAAERMRMQQRRAADVALALQRRHAQEGPEDDGTGGVRVPRVTPPNTPAGSMALAMSA